MSYQVLARKWRPRFFREMVGQEHVLQALINALDHNRLHHAYLFTGTRGVGKTTIARILAKCLNCEVGVSSEPCGQCSSCVEIAQGSFVDLIEVDAASRTKVEDTRELLDNVQYAPSKGRFKVYLIDEVHMLSTHSFNALLKTLEEPPAHVKFLLATTDPQKLPPTILSRCLQFHLKNMSPEKIVGHLQHVLTQETMVFEESALWSLARSANGSMRDALSLTDQAIAFGTGNISAQAVSSMLGSIDQQTVYNLMQGLINYNAQDLMQEVAKFSEHAPDYAAVLDELLMLIHRLSLAQISADCVDNSEGDREKVLALAGQLSAEELQLFYQMAILGKRDLGLAPDLRTGFEMTLIRLLAFRPAGIQEPLNRVLPQGSAATIESGVADEKSAEVPLVKKTEQGEVPAVQLAPVTSVNDEGDRIKPVAEQAVELNVPAVTVEPAALAIVESGEPDTMDIPETVVPQQQAATSNDMSAAVVGSSPELKLEVKEATVASAMTAVQSDSGGDLQHSQVEADEATPAVIDDSLSSLNTDAAQLTLPNSQADWLCIFHKLPFQGLLKSIAAECVLLNVAVVSGTRVLSLLLNLSHAQLYNARQQEAMQEALQRLSVEPLKIDIQAVDAKEFSQLSNGLLTASQNDARLEQLEQQRAEAEIAADHVLASVIEAFDAQIIEGSVRSIDG